MLGTPPKRLLREQVARLQLLDIAVRNAADLDGFAIDLRHGPLVVRATTAEGRHYKTSINEDVSGYNRSRANISS